MTTDEIVGYLNGIYAEEGTVIGYHKRTQRFLAAHSQFINEDGSGGGTRIRYATQEELNKIGTIEPRSVVEHKGIRRRRTPYGLARVVARRPRVSPIVVARKK